VNFPWHKQTGRYGRHLATGVCCAACFGSVAHGSGFWPGWSPAPADATIRTTQQCINYNSGDIPVETGFAGAVVASVQVDAELLEIPGEISEDVGAGALYVLASALVPGEFTANFLCTYDGYIYMVDVVRLEDDLDIGTITDAPVLVAAERITQGDDDYVETTWSVPSAEVGGWLLELRLTSTGRPLAWVQPQEFPLDLAAWLPLDDLENTVDPICLTGLYYTPTHELTDTFELDCFDMPAAALDGDSGSDQGEDPSKPGCGRCTASPGPPNASLLLPLVLVLGARWTRRGLFQARGRPREGLEPTFDARSV
jgi:hypothetical protein